ncbi:hypothetical protein [Campylobacter sp. RM16192]|uniref:hypothetical protein n=1 Tax=Campylobacter sp. RM16192 TaxID=1660080 RepID=UPI001452379E|nr:hypothetical protein [Campylobacter sp. RM16192]QCD52831.1 hypothetical protein CDOMC_1224 [Campylobacter sp. RM16192]
MSSKIQKSKTNKPPAHNKDEQSPTLHQKQQLVAMHKGYQGPIPSPEFMQSYAEIDPSFPDRIFKLTEDNMQHQYRHQNKMDVLQFLGWFSATTITLTAMGLGAYLLMNDKDLAGFSFLVGSALPSLVIYFTNKTRQANNGK